MFPEVYYMQGSSMNRADLVAAGVGRARAATVISYSSELTSDDPNMADGFSVLSTNNIETLAPSCIVIAELGELFVPGSDRSTQ
jgi:hypothetical protein